MFVTVGMCQEAVDAYLKVDAGILLWNAGFKLCGKKFKK